MLFIAENDQLWMIILEDRLSRDSAISSPGSRLNPMSQNLKRKWNETFLQLPSSLATTTTAAFTPTTSEAAKPITATPSR